MPKKPNEAEFIATILTTYSNDQELPNKLKLRVDQLSEHDRGVLAGLCGAWTMTAQLTEDDDLLRPLHGEITMRFSKLTGMGQSKKDPLPDSIYNNIDQCPECIPAKRKKRRAS